MCGITGFLFSPGQALVEVAETRLGDMMTAIAHRGPDSQGHWVDAGSGVALGHLRLAIVDLSPAGHQPMPSASGRFEVVFNGEIYNHHKLRRELEEAGHAPVWRGTSDTEVMMAGFEVWGVEETLARLEGMFAIALWDRETRTLKLVRDRLGEKPLYYGWQGKGRDAVFLFGSELKALQAHPAFDARIRRDAIVAMLRHGHVPEDLVIYEGLRKLRPGEIAEISLEAPEPKRKLYWDGGAIAAAPRGPAPSDEDAIERLNSLLLDAVSQEMMSDVPLGAFLSGGIDSSVVVGLMQHLSKKPVHTFSIGFHEARYNEAQYAKEVADHLGTHHTELYVSDTDLRDVIPRLPHMYDEPFADSSQIPTFLVAEMAREHVTVALSGDGGDELFCGYDRYVHGQKMMDKLRGLPGPLRSLGGAAIRAIPETWLNKVMEPIRATPQGKEPNGQRLHRLANYAMSTSTEELHQKMVSVWRFPEDAVLGGSSPPSILADHLPPRGNLSDMERMMQLDMLAYLPDDILCKVDRATMAVALESRAPLLDHRVAEFIWALPERFKYRDGKSKWLLRQVLYKYVPAALIERPKMGFEVPIGLWLRGGLRDWAQALLDPDRLRREGYLDEAVITRLWSQHLVGSHNWGAQLWNVLMFQAWLETYGDVTPA
ncbi:asparagine synthase (glutamine-hydrolysing) [Litoreibacter halocynthiae]|uniref:asparagine synthase (glutamine-hydrolyzing) n=1 Tax=Litoreibacter halocynthiae TaxID=1242689 RepID=A0A4R7LC44_9RHOB|nr:asparagine synthase (glutamine-hydrolyzing) [Litoreibacter halocynthiae]TDT73103.1 asparagine synthase (glutamine-hydrolysing) [Litoreibacter halocynthiae]